MCKRQEGKECQRGEGGGCWGPAKKKNGKTEESSTWAIMITLRVDLKENERAQGLISLLPGAEI